MNFSKKETVSMNKSTMKLSISSVYEVEIKNSCNWDREKSC